MFAIINIKVKGILIEEAYRIRITPVLCLIYRDEPFKLLDSIFDIIFTVIGLNNFEYIRDCDYETL